MIKGRLYVWVKPAFTRKVWHSWQPQHTWVTSHTNFDDTSLDASKGDYWHCRGAYCAVQSASPLIEGVGDLDVARMICKPHDRRESAGIPLFWGIHGICYQIANRILYSTVQKNGDPITVENAKGYRLAARIYGPYGCKRSPKCREIWDIMKARANALM